MDFKISSNWLEPTARASNELDATMAAFRLLLDGKNVTEYASLEQCRKGTQATHEKLHIPVYLLAEWIAENWWPLLYEPRKSERNDDLTFYSRHSIISAQHGFALPDLQFEPLGEDIRIVARQREAAGPGVKFLHSAETRMARASAETVLNGFIVSCVQRLDSCSVKATPLQQAWQDIKQTSKEQFVFCRLAGALGVNPYEIDPDLAGIVDQVFENIGERAALDLCMASTPDELKTLVDVTSRIAEQLAGAHESTLAPLENLRLQSDNIQLPSWRRGNNAALNVRKLLDIKPSDDAGCDKFLDILRVSTSTSDGSNENEEVLFTGAVDREEMNARFVLLQNREEGRRFAASRGVYLAMSSNTRTTRLVTDALTRDQQASRAFAAEMLVPYDCLRPKVRNGKLALDEVLDIARRRRASVDVVKYQATNKGVVVTASL